MRGGEDKQEEGKVGGGEQVELRVDVRAKVGVEVRPRVGVVGVEVGVEVKVELPVEV